MHDLTMKQKDNGHGPKLRFTWEYLECVGYDKNFYEELVVEHRKVVNEEKAKEGF